MPEAQRDLVFRCRSRLGGLLRREGKLEDAENLLKPLLGDQTVVRAKSGPSRIKRLGVRVRSIVRRPDDRAGLDAYELGYIAFLRGELKSARRWFLYGFNLGLASGDRSGAWISRCLAANCSFIANNNSRESSRVLRKARPIFEEGTRRGDANAQRWIMNVIAHSLEVAVHENDAVEARRLHTNLVNDPWVSEYVDEIWLLRFDAMLAKVEGRYEDSANDYRRFLDHIKSDAEQYARYLLDYGLVLEHLGEDEAARKVWQSAGALPPDRGNKPWQDRIQRLLN